MWIETHSVFIVPFDSVNVRIDVRTPVNAGVPADLEHLSAVQLSQQDRAIRMLFFIFHIVILHS